MNMAGKQPAYPVLQCGSVPAGGRSRPGTAWVGRIRSTAEKKRGVQLHGVYVNAEAGLPYREHDSRGTTTYSLLFLHSTFTVTLGVRFVQGAKLCNSRIQNTFPNN